MSEKYNITRKGVTKFDPDTAKVLPISTGRKRYKAWSVARSYNGLEIEINAFESLNGYDYIALFQMIDDYQKNHEGWEYQCKMQIDNESERILMRREFDLSHICKQRGIDTHKNNRKSIAKSFERWYKAELIYKYDDSEPIHTRYIFEYRIDKDYKKMTIVANVNFLELCIKNGMAMNWERLARYGKSQYGLELDIYLQFRAIQYGKKAKKYKYPDVIKEETLFNHTGIDGEVSDIREKRRKLKQAFDKFNEIVGIRYIYDKDERKWIKEGYKRYIDNKK